MPLIHIKSTWPPVLPSMNLHATTGNILRLLSVAWAAVAKTQQGSILPVVAVFVSKAAYQVSLPLLLLPG